MESKSNSALQSSSVAIVKGRFKTLCPPVSFDGTETILIRHGESIAEVFPDWAEKSRLDANYYLPYDLNLPIQVPRREHMRAAYKVDPPLSEIGKMSTQLLAREIADRHATSIDIIYVAPTLACLETAHEIQSYLGQRCGSIRVESALITSSKGRDHWMQREQLEKLGYRMDEGYDVNKVQQKVKTDSFDFEDIVKKLKKFFDGLKASLGTVLIVSDSLATKILSDLSNGIHPIPRLGQDFRAQAENAFPPSATYVLRHEKGLGGTSLEPCPYSLRPITCIGASSQPNRDPTCV